ncbi:MAG: hypothetical protein KY469_06550 [Actinobacteria bacterium]|nr:hypothetical protein [Actinomycetota bacterium]
MGSRLVRDALIGAVAGTVGTLAMDLLWYQRYRSGGGEDSFTEWEFVNSTESFDDASAPGEVGKRLADTVGVDLPDEAAGTTTNVMHWLTGIGYGIGHGLLQRGRGTITGGVLTGVGAFTNSYVTLGAMGVYKPMWEYDAQTLMKDLSAHIVYGLATSAAFATLTSSDDD